LYALYIAGIPSEQTVTEQLEGLARDVLPEAMRAPSV